MGVRVTAAGAWARFTGSARDRGECLGAVHRGAGDLGESLGVVHELAFAHPRAHGQQQHDGVMRTAQRS